MRKALIVGINHYAHLDALSGCVADAAEVKNVLERHADKTTNFQTPKLMLGNNAADAISKSNLKTAVRALFADDAEIALFYFAGHGHVEDTGGYICASDSESGDDGLALSEVITLAANSPAKNKVIILDSCHSGSAGNSPVAANNSAEITEGMTILTASTATQSAMERPAGSGGGVFTNLLVDALNGAAMNLLGDITPGSVYAHIDQSLGTWAQRPMFKTHVKSFVSLRKAAPPIERSELQALARYFPSSDFVFHLDPAFEPERTTEQKADTSIPAPDSKKTAVFAILQNYVKVNLVRPVGAKHMWHAAMERKACELTVLGKHYRSLVAEGLI